jgi:uncharacterized membrane protein YuzA (DUF378 family)
LGKKRVAMRPQNPLDSLAFVFLLIGAFAWGYYFLTGLNVIDNVSRPVSNTLAAIVYILIVLSGIYWILRVTVLRSWGGGWSSRWRGRRRR